MKKILIIIILCLCFSTKSIADNIKNIQVDGISIGDKVLDHISMNEYKQNPKEKFYKDKNVITVGKYDSDTYDRIQLTYLKNDKDKKIHAISGVIVYPTDFQKCLDQKEKILKNILEVTNKNRSDVKNGVDPLNFDNIGKSKMHYSVIIFNDGGITQISCNDWSDKITKKNDWEDDLKVSIFSKESRSFMFAP